jgi:hypothetical protein
MKKNIFLEILLDSSILFLMFVKAKSGSDRLAKYTSRWALADYKHRPPGGNVGTSTSCASELNGSQSSKK